jgi:hypothetical protein
MSVRFYKFPRGKAPGVPEFLIGLRSACYYLLLAI